MSKITMQHHCT